MIAAELKKINMKSKYPVERDVCINSGNKLERMVTILDDTTAIKRSNVQLILNKSINRLCKKPTPYYSLINNPFINITNALSQIHWCSSQFCFLYYYMNGD